MIRVSHMYTLRHTTSVWQLSGHSAGAPALGSPDETEKTVR
jgi:hypothetical protein